MTRTQWLLSTAAFFLLILAAAFALRPVQRDGSGSRPFVEADPLRETPSAPTPALIRYPQPGEGAFGSGGPGRVGFGDAPVTLTGDVFNDRGSLPFFELFFVSADGSRFFSARGNSRGRYRVELPPDWYEVHGRRIGSIGLLSSVLLTGETAAQELDIEAPPVGRLVVHVVGNGGEEIHLSLTHARLHRAPALTAHLDAADSWQVHLTEGEYRLRAWTVSGLYAEESTGVKPREQVEVALALRPVPGLLMGRVVDLATGAGLGGVRLQGLPEFSQSAGWSGPNGDFVIAPGNRSPSTIRAMLPGYLDQEQDVRGCRGQTPCRVVLEMSPGVELAGTVLGQDGRPVQGARVTVKGRNQLTRYATSELGGRFSVTGLSPGPVRVWASTLELSSRVETVQAPHERFTLKLSEPGLRVTGQARLPGGAPLTKPFGVQLLVDETQPETRAWRAPGDLSRLHEAARQGAAERLNRVHDYPGMFRDPSGRFELFGLAPGRYRLAILGKHSGESGETYFYGKSEPFEVGGRSNPPLFVPVEVE